MNRLRNGEVRRRGRLNHLHKVVQTRYSKMGDANQQKKAALFVRRSSIAPRGEKGRTVPNALAAALALGEESIGSSSSAIESSPVVRTGPNPNAGERWIGFNPCPP